MARVCVVEDDQEMGSLLRQLLEQAGHQVTLHATPGRFFDWLLKNRPELVMVDMRLPGMDGREVVRILRMNPGTKEIRIIAMSGCERDSADAVRAFEAGADEYLTKPIDGDLLSVRIRTLLERSSSQTPQEEVIEFESLSLCPGQRLCRLGKKEVTLTRMEFDLLEYFLRHPDRVLTRGHLLQYVWGGEPTMTTGTVNKHVETLRRKLGPVGRRIETVVRVGYVLRMDGGVQ